jgi:hypothetical protein
MVKVLGNPGKSLMLPSSFNDTEYAPRWESGICVCGFATDFREDWRLIVLGDYSMLMCPRI